jgi:NDP-sugar pyrophosphorylase family protein
MKALIFAAGLGTRLKPITDNLPKALVPIAGKPLLQHVILKLKAQGFDEILINVHHFPDQIINFVKVNNAFGIRIEISDEREMLLDTGGGIKKVAYFFDDNKPFLVHNVDILSTLNLNELYHQHLRTNPLATLVVSKRDTFRYLLFDDDLRLRGWINEKTSETKPSDFQHPERFAKFAFSGIQILSPQVFNVMESYPLKFPIMDFYLENMKQNNILSFVPNDYKMIDVGKLNVLEEAEKFVINYK